mmetsp:Transcript_24743/g.35511  ORF Transcript_24743/g.35511 Transcript_24743/m.35511 type:complete len:410 (-) Transcript_24743:963-2192(-)
MASRRRLSIASIFFTALLLLLALAFILSNAKPPLTAVFGTHGTSELHSFEKSLFLPKEYRHEPSVLGSAEDNVNVDGDIIHVIGEDYIKLLLETDSKTDFDDLSSRLVPSLSGPYKRRETPQKIRHTGTTIAGCVAEGGKFVVIAADSRATEESVVADKICEKVHKLTENVWCCGAGTSADNDELVRQIRYSFMLDGMVKESIGNFKVASQNPYWEKRGIANVSAVCRRIRKLMYDAKGNLGVNLVLGGFDFWSDTAILAAIHPHGSMDTVPFTALGSGGLAAMGILESGYNPDITLDEAVKLVKAAIAAGISNDLGSGSQIDLCIIGRQFARYNRAYVKEEDLPTTDYDKANAAELHCRHRTGEEDRRSGVSGFGSLPFSVKSRRLVMKSDEAIDQSRREWLNLSLDL